MMLATAQAPLHAVKEVDLSNEPHHRLLFENQAVRVFRLTLQPGESTLPHFHRRFYAYVGISPVTISNEVRGRAPVITRLEAGDLHTSKGGFALTERDISPVPANVIVVEAEAATGHEFTSPMGAFHYHDAAFGELFENDVMRGYTMTVAAAGRIERHVEDYDRLVIAISNLQLHVSENDGTPDLKMMPGDVRWLPRGIADTVVNSGGSPATFIVLELN